MSDQDETYSIPLSSIMKDPQKDKKKSVDKNELMAAMEETGKNINDAKGIFELLPDVVMAKQLLVASVLSPKDAMPASLDIRVNNKKIADSVKTANALTAINKHFSTVHDLDSVIETIIGDVLFDYGSYIHIYLPRTELDKQIAAAKSFGVEDIKDTFSNNFMSERTGFIGGNQGNLAGTGITSITDRLDILRRPKLERGVQAQLGMEALGIASDTNGTKGYVSINTSEETDKGNPMVFRAPSDSVIPIIEPGQPDNHVGYFVLLDERGNFLSSIRDSNQMEQLINRVKAARKDDQKSQEYIVVTNMGKDLNVDQKKEPTSLINAYINCIESELKDAVKGGYYGDTVEVTRPEAVYRIMFARAMEKKKTRILYVPAELVTYYAYEHDAMGVGVSLMDKTRFIASLRAILLISDMMGSVKNSVSQTVLSVELDEDETDPSAVLSTIRHEYSKLQTSQLPAGIYNPSDIISALQNGSVRMSVTGGSKFPGTKLDVEDRQRSVARTDQDLSDQLKRLHMNGLWTIPELVDQALQGETATGIVSNNIMMAKRAATVQRWYRRQVGGDIQRYTRLSGELMEIIAKEIPADQIDEFIESLEPHFPEVNAAAIKAQMEAFEEYATSVDTIVESYISEDMFADIAQGENAPDIIDNVRAAVAGHFKRRYLEEQGLLPEIQSLYDQGEEDKGIAKDIADHYAGIIASMEKIMKVVIRKEARLDDKLEAERNKTGEPEEEEGGSVTPPDDGGGADDVVDDIPAEPTEEDDVVVPENDDGIDPAEPEPEPEEV